MWLAYPVQWWWVDRTCDTVKQPGSQLHFQQVSCLLTTRSKMFRQYLKCSLTSTKMYWTSTSSGFIFCFFLPSLLSEPGRPGTALSRPASRLAIGKTSSSCDTSRTVDCCSFAICQTQSLEEEKWTWKGWRTFTWMNWLSCDDPNFFFVVVQCLRGEGEDSERCETKFSAGVTVKFTAPTTLHVEERQPECSQRHSKCEQEDGVAVSDSELIVP